MASLLLAHSFLALLLLWSFVTISNANLMLNFYARTCPNVESIVRTTMAQIVAEESRMAASVLRLHFHDCFVNGCDASILLDDTPTFKGEKLATPNVNSMRGYKAIDRIKGNVEAFCKGKVSCSDILTLAARDAVVLSGGPGWPVRLGRRDARTASLAAANAHLPPPSVNNAILTSFFAAKNLTVRDMTALSGAHTIGVARCTTFRHRLYNDKNINPNFATTKRATCPLTGGDNILSPLDMASPTRFDNSYFKNVLANQGLLHSDQEMFNGGPQQEWARLYAKSNLEFGKDFVNGMIKMSNISPLTGLRGEIRRNCRLVN